MDNATKAFIGVVAIVLIVGVAYMGFLQYKADTTPAGQGYEEFNHSLVPVNGPPSAANPHPVSIESGKPVS